MSWTPEQRRRHAPAIGEAVRASATVRLAATVDIIDPPPRTGRPRLWSTLTAGSSGHRNACLRRP